MNERWAGMLRAVRVPATRAGDPGAQAPLCHSPLFRKTIAMADDAGIPDFIDTNDGNGADNLPQVGILAQYVKDLSFENPNSPAVFQWQGQPQTDVQVNIGVSGVGQDVHEVVLKIEVEAKGNEGVAFRVETLYAGLFAIRNVPDDQL